MGGETFTYRQLLAELTLLVGTDPTGGGPIGRGWVLFRVGKRHKPIEFGFEVRCEVGTDVAADRIDEVQNTAIENSRDLVWIGLIDAEHLSHGIEPLVTAC